jgi:hypothetical protein
MVSDKSKNFDAQDFDLFDGAINVNDMISGSIISNGCSENLPNSGND